MIITGYFWATVENAKLGIRGALAADGAPGDPPPGDDGPGLLGRPGPA